MPVVSTRWRLSAPIFGAQFGNLVVAGGRLARREQIAEAEEQDGGEGENQRRKQTTGHAYSKFGSCTNSVARGDFPPPLSLGPTQLQGELAE